MKKLFLKHSIFSILLIHDPYLFVCTITLFTFIHIGVQNLPVSYYNNKKAWMTSNIWREFVHKLDREMARKKRKIVLVIDNCPAHPNIEDLSNLRLVFLPPNTTSHGQPLDAGIIKNLKQYYRKNMVSRLVQSLDENVEFKPSLLFCLNLLKQAWMSVKKETIVNCFAHCGFVSQSLLVDDGTFQPEEVVLECDNIFERLKALGFSIDSTFDDLVAVDEGAAISEQTTNEDILSSVIHADIESGESDTEVVAVHDEPPPIVKFSEAIKATDTLLLYMQQNNIADTNAVYNIQSTLFAKPPNTHKQSKITDFFSC